MDGHGSHRIPGRLRNPFDLDELHEICGPETGRALVLTRDCEQLPQTAAIGGAAGAGATGVARRGGL